MHGPRHADDIAAPIRRALGRGGSVLIPAFAVDRTPVVLMTQAEIPEQYEYGTVLV